MIDRIHDDKLYKTFFDLKNVLCIQKDNNNNIIYPTDKEKLKLYSEILKSKIKVGNQYYHIDSKTWYKISSKEVINTDGDIVKIDFLEDITKTKEELYNSKIDSLTMLLKDRNESNKLILEYVEYAFDNNEEFAIVMCDIDDFKIINDTYGHVCGDLVLKNIGKILLSNTRQSEDKFDYRPSDIITRVGGDEFLLLLKNMSKEDVKDKVETLEEKVKNMNVSYINNQIPVNMTFGYCCINPKINKPNSIMAFIESINEIADEWLYVNKNRKKLEQEEQVKQLKR